MNGNDARETFEQEWHRIIHDKSQGKQKLVSICGPAGVGKTTLVKTLSYDCSVFIETAHGNPYLAGLLELKIDFNAAANQTWFLQRIGEDIARANLNLPLVLDQDPAAIVFTYSRMFLDDGKMTEVQYATLLEYLLQIEEALRNWKSPRKILVLDAPPEVLYKRVFRRSSGKTPPIEWFAKLRKYFNNFAETLPNKFMLSTVDLSAEEVAKKARAMLAAS